MTEPISLVVTRWKCPHCQRSRAQRATTVKHMSRCWRNPETRSCKTCRHFEPGGGSPDHGMYDPSEEEHCAVGVDLSGRPPCERCGGYGRLFEGGVSDCRQCGGDGAEVKPGPITDCELWEATP